MPAFGAGLLTGLLLALLCAAGLMAAYISTDMDRFEAWLDKQ